MWKQNFMFIQTGAAPIDKTENELFHDVPQAMDSAGLNGERYISVWVQGEEKNGKPVMYTNIYARRPSWTPVGRRDCCSPCRGGLIKSRGSCLTRRRPGSGSG